MIVLALESATSHQNLAIFRDQELLGYVECDSTRSLTPQIIPCFHQLLNQASLSIVDVQGLAISIGPGTFTGLRVGLATMTALRFALGIPLVGVSTLEGLAWNLPDSDLPILSTVAIRADMVYWGRFQWQQGTLVSLVNDQIGKTTEVMASLSEPTIVLGDAWIRQQECFLPRPSPFIIAGPSEALIPSAKGIALAGRSLLKKGEWLPEGCTPRYVQPAYAEIPQSTISL